MSEINNPTSLKLQGASKQKNIPYMPADIEKKWQEVWKTQQLYHPDIEQAKHPFYNLMMFPYPSAEGLHVGNMYAFTGTDIYGRFKRMQGFDVLEPIGLDGFGIHSENYALKIGKHPMEQAEIAEQNFYRQLASIGNGFDWERTVETYHADYYKWTQWVFTQLFKAGLAYRKTSGVNYCPSCKTVLSDEQVIDGKCERCSSEVEKKELEQWFFRITKYAERLLTNLEQIDWSEKVKVAQKQWIGKSVGAEVEFKVETLPTGGQDGALSIPVFTTRPDTLYGVTFLVLSPGHPLLQDEAFRQMVTDLSLLDVYISDAKNVQKKEANDEKTGVDTGVKAIHPLTGELLPIWVADYVLMGYGTGAIMAVPAHDERDYAFATQFNLPIKTVISGPEEIESPLYTGPGTIINSQEWNGLKIPAEKETVITSLEEKKWGKKAVNYHLRDWLISRQRYWGAPIPMVYCAHCAKQNKSWFSENEQPLPNDWNAAGWFPVEEKDLPVTLPYIEDYKPLGTGKSPLASHKEFYETRCPACGSEAIRETDVSDTFLDSAWYFFRYTSTDLSMVPFAKDRVAKWLPVDSYIGGAEHSVLHLLYARFITMVFKDLGYIDFEEPFTTFYAHGLLIKDGAKMSKSKGNVIVPDEYIKKFGADTLRTYLMFLGPFNEGGDFRDTGIEGIFKFLKRVWTLFTTKPLVDTASDTDAEAFMHKTIRDITADMEALRYNTAIAKLMMYYNLLSDKPSLSTQHAEAFLKMLAPFAPHLTEELWQQINGEWRRENGEITDEKHKNSQFSTLNSQLSIHVQPWPVFDPARIQEGHVMLAVQVNGKVRETVELEKQNISQSDVEAMARKSDKVNKYLEGKTVKKVIYVPGKILNFVV